MTLRYGGLVGSELQDVVWAVYGVAFHVHVPFLTPDGDFTIERDDENSMRGTEASIEGKACALELIGFIQGLRGGAWLSFKEGSQLMSPFAKYTAMHTATLAQGIRRAWERAPNNRLVARAVQRGLRDCTIFTSGYVRGSRSTCWS